ncbi:MAG: TldD/PmbA family protein [Pseudomonadota bacterium]
MDNDALIALAARAVEAATRAGADGADALAITSAEVNAGIRNGAPETIERAESRGIGLRVFVGASYATLSTSDVSADALTNLATTAVAIARAAPADPYATLAPAADLAHDYPKLDAADDTLPDITALQHAAREAEEAGRAVSGITNSEGGDASASRTSIALATSHGFTGHYSVARYAVSASLIAGSGDSMQRDYDYAMTTRYRDLPSAASIGTSAATRAIARMNPRKVPSQQAVVYFEPRVGRQFLSAFAGAISGAAITRGTSFLKDALGTQVFNNRITITDDPLRAQGLASRPFDVEGIAAKKFDFIDAGRLTSWVLDTRCANQLGLKTTGHASRGLASAPNPSTSNLYLHGGNQSPAELFAQMGDGFYVTETIGHGVNLITGDYSVGASGFWLEGGVRAFAVSEVTIAGNLRDIFRELVAADDLTFHYATNVPTLAVPRMTIAGN